MKVNIEFNIINNTVYLYYWNAYNADDIIVELKNNKLYLIPYDEEGNKLPKEEISFLDFFTGIKKRITEANESN